jgi:CMP-N-acetylneuraminic acid synthetase
MFTHCALITAKGNNQSLPDKNLITIAGKPSLQYVIEAAKGARRISQVYLSTEDPRIRELGTALGCRIIDRPASLAQPDTNHGDVMRHGIDHIKKETGNLGCITALLGNTVMVNPDLIDLSLRILDRRPELDSVMSVWQAQDDHPYRAMCLDDRGYLKSYLNIRSGTSRQYYPAVYYYDQGVWTFRHQCVYERKGPNPWWWMGENSFPILRNWVTGRDFHSQIDLDFSDYWIRFEHKDEILNMDEIKKLLD